MWRLDCSIPYFHTVYGILWFAITVLPGDDLETS